MLRPAGCALCGLLSPPNICHAFLCVQMENPDLMFRVSGYYMHVRSLDELPIDLQVRELGGCSWWVRCCRTRGQGCCHGHYSMLPRAWSRPRDA